MRVIAFLSMERASTQLSALWGDDVATGTGLQLQKLQVIVSEYEGPPDAGCVDLVTAHGIDPARAGGHPDPFVFEAALKRSALAVFLQSVINCQQPFAGLLTKWVSKVPLPVNTITGVVVPNSDPPTAEPKFSALLGYADAARDAEPAPPATANLAGGAIPAGGGSPSGPGATLTRSGGKRAS